ncbi:MAG: cell division FtsA domain-containing protein, partial [Dehalococcoidia bacterium]
SAVSCRAMCQIIRYRVEEILELILDRIETAEVQGGLPGGVVLTGGTAKLPGIDTLAREVLNLPVRIGRPRMIDGTPASVQDPAFATSMGIINWKLVYEDGESKLDRLGYINYFNQFSKRMLTRVEGPPLNPSMQLEPEAQG